MKPHADVAPTDVLAGFGDLEGLRKLAVRLVRNDAEADDVVQESLLLGLRRAAGRILNPRAWLSGIVRNKARESRRAAARRQARESEARPGANPMNPIDIAARVEVHDQLVLAVKSLEEPCRSAVWLHYVEGRAASEIARELGVPVETVRTRVKRGIAKLREELDRRHRGKRADWVPALALFAGVEPSLALVGATAAGTVFAAKPLAIAAAVLAVVGGTAFLGLSVLSPKPEVPARSQPEPTPEHEHPEFVDREPAAAGLEIAATAPTEASARPDRKTITPRPFAEGQSGPAAADLPPNEGTFSFHYLQGFSFESRTVTSDLEGADLVFKSAAGGISSVTLETPGGAILGLERVGERFDRVTEQFPGGLKHAQALARSVVRAAPAAVGAGTTADGRDNNPGSDAFLLRTRLGKWVVLAITARSEDGGWTKRPITVRYATSDTPVFRPGSGDVAVDGIEVDSQLLARLDREIEEEAERARRAREEPFLRKLEELDRKAAAMEPSVKARDGADVRVAAVLDRVFAKPMGFNAAYVASTYSFEKATRDDVKATGNDWDFLLASELDVRTVADDRSLIWDLGDASIENARAGSVTAAKGGERAAVVAGHLYAIHTADSETDQWALMRIEELVPGESLIFAWVVLKDPAALRDALSGADTMQSAQARLQVRGGARGGNPFRVTLNRSTNEALSESPLDLAKPLTQNERHVAYVSGGTVPPGKVFVVGRIEYSARVQGDGNGHGEFILWVGSHPVAHVREERTAGMGKEFRWFRLDHGDQTTTVEAMPVRGELSVNIPIRRGAESEVYVEIANSSWADVTLTGRFVAAAEAPPPYKRPDPFLLRELERIAEASDEASIAAAGRRLSSQTATALNVLLESIPPGAWRDKVKLAIDQVAR